MSRPGNVINIAGATPIDDPEYRYKMPVVYGKIEGRGNGIKTVIPNITVVGLSLHRDPGEVNKFFGCELGAQTTYSELTDRAVVNGAHTDVVLQNMIKRYIDEFVLCPGCCLPETEYKIKNGCIYHKCAACGAKEMVDMSHKLCNYILAQDKKAKKEGKGKKKKDKNEKDEKKKDKKDKKKSKESANEDGSDPEKKKKEKKDKKKKKKSKKSSESPTKGDLVDEEEEEIPEVDDASVGSQEDVDDAAAMNMAVEGTRKFMEENPDAIPGEIAEVVINQQMASSLKSHDKVHIFVRAAINSKVFENKQIQKYSPVISNITQDNPVMGRHLIAAMEGLCIEKPKSFPVIIKQLYDEDALEEDVILEWAGEGRSDYTLDIVDEETRADRKSVV